MLLDTLLVRYAKDQTWDLLQSMWPFSFLGLLGNTATTLFSSFSHPHIYLASLENYQLPVSALFLQSIYDLSSYFRAQSNQNQALFGPID